MYYLSTKQTIHMKKTALHLGGLLLMFAIAGCNGNNGTANTADSTATSTTNTQMNPGDSSVTTTTTTTVTHHRYTGTFTPQPTTKYLDLKTHKQVTVRIDTVQGDLVNTETNEPVELLVEPTTHDTIYGQTGTVVNNYIIKDESGYRVDTVRINSVETHNVPVPAPAAGKEKTKTKSSNGDKVKEKTK
jgi:hypothetical protein